MAVIWTLLLISIVSIEIQAQAPPHRAPSNNRRVNARRKYNFKNRASFF